jgi:hypothetical protein
MALQDAALVFIAHRQRKWGQQGMETLPNHGFRETVRYAARKAPMVAVTVRTTIWAEPAAGFATLKPRSGIALKHILKKSITISNMSICASHDYLV